MESTFIIQDIFRNRKVAGSVDLLVVLLAILSGLLHPSPKMFYESVLIVFLILAIPLMLLSFIIYRFSENYGHRIQGERKKSPPIAHEAFGTIRAMFIVACMVGWPVGMYRMGLPTGLVWTVEEMGLSWWMVILEMYLGIVLVDAMTYWKHRLLHTRMFFPFHKHHHTFRDPTPFSGFAVGPVETLLTFWPLLLICFPVAKHFAPLYFTAIIGFVLLNLYLHCGVTFKWLEKILPKIGLNSSAWHNIHHSDVNANFGEVSYIWDKICKTTRTDMHRRKAAKA
jgi:sterol desaturase/sphingolipid hydroxylase (fatty acid hydroxylase superfamily)